MTDFEQVKQDALEFVQNALSPDQYDWKPIKTSESSVSEAVSSDTGGNAKLAKVIE